MVAGGRLALAARAHDGTRIWGPLLECTFNNSDLSLVNSTIQNRTAECPACCASACSEQTLFGVGPYPSAASICCAAIFDGVITNEAGGPVMVTWQEGQQSYPGDESNGLTSGEYGSSSDSFWFNDLFFPRPPSPPPPARSPPPWASTCVQCPAGCAAASRDVWGTGVYTADSPVCKAAIHAGLITNTSGGVVTVYWDSGRELYAGTTAHGITSSDYGAYDSAFAFAQRPPPSPPTQPTWLCETQGREYASEAEPVVAMQCPAGCLSEPRDVWGTGVYTSDSPVCKAAIHAGLITNTSSGLVTIYWDTGKASYTGSYANGVQSEPCGEYPSSFAFNPRPTPSPPTPPQPPLPPAPPPPPAPTIACDTTAVGRLSRETFAIVEVGGGWAGGGGGLCCLGVPTTTRPHYPALWLEHGDARR
ncbi:hypothetical protein CHLNCDRAFT_135134 [Chlorella variabilis]|uniref:LCCL domain-containing protein n=1 Tax=Chlorella variabilis TaxID=554065 RepID=E1ZHK0_CHLVA|nr:hypothetical protein CHLNCDRAFT_135134 [Chlorella variabilis]EFN54616.1 hypothetical protein CHLNCDRAFT_135134 [Chlorella variabilis]|eukprot:XP_005846718.1 hypothetical protein CHLNCDRAFT_135134 [Chlorella variabilis]